MKKVFLSLSSALWDTAMASCQGGCAGFVEWMLQGKSCSLGASYVPQIWWHVGALFLPCDFSVPGMEVVDQHGCLWNRREAVGRSQLHVLGAWRLCRRSDLSLELVLRMGCLE